MGLLLTKNNSTLLDRNKITFFYFSHRSIFIQKQFKNKEEFKNEIDILNRLITCKGIIQPIGHDPKRLIINYPYYSCDLFHFAQNFHSTQFQKQIIYYRLLNIINKLHKLGIEHHDIKLENCLIDISTLEIYLIDFEMASSDFTTDIHHIRNGTMYYLPPESICRTNIEFGKKDIWALAIFFCIFFNKFYPITENRWIHYHNLIKSTNNFPNFLKKCFTWEPSLRPNINELIDLFCNDSFNN